MSKSHAAVIAPRPAETTALRRRRWLADAVRQSAVRETVLTLVILAVLEILVFGSYFRGNISPAPDDFIASYNNEPFAWWRDLFSSGSPDWVPYAWGGFPSALSIQNGSWYIPIGVLAALTPYSIHAAAVLQALHVGFGALGVHFLARRWKLHYLAAVFGMVSYFFAVGFYSNGLHPDIVRGFAWAPWVFVCLTPAFPWRRRWSIPVAALIFWQAAAGTYPGILVALIYGGAVVVLLTQVTERPRFRVYLAPLTVSAVAAALLSVPKYLEAVLLRDGQAVTGPDVSVFSRGMLGTLFFPYDMPNFPNDLSMRSFFVVAPTLALALTAWRRAARPWPVVAFGGTALLFGMPFLPWYSIVSKLPGMGLSRFRMSDFRVPLVLTATILAMLALSLRLGYTKDGEGDAPARTRRSQTVDALALGLLVSGAAIIAKADKYPIERWTTPWMVLASSAVIVWYFWARDLERVRGAAVGLVGLAAVSGVNWAFSVPAPWRFPLHSIEDRAWGATAEELIAAYSPPEVQVQRPARIPLDDAVAPPTNVHWNSSFYTGRDAVGGYINIKGAPAFGAELVAVTTPSTYFQSRSLLAAPGIGVEVASARDLPAPKVTEECARSGACGANLVERPVRYTRGHLKYALDATSDTKVLFNESYYPGWTITACGHGDANCRTLNSTMGGAGLILVDVPRGSWDIALDYETPGKVRDYGAFASGILLLVVAAIVPGSPLSRRGRGAWGHRSRLESPRFG